MEKEITHEEFQAWYKLVEFLLKLKLPTPNISLNIRVDSPPINVLGRSEPVEYNTCEYHYFITEEK